MDYRTEEDSLGEVKVPDDAYYGAFTVRALDNFQITGRKAHPAFFRSLAEIKKAAAQVNRELGDLDDEKADAIIQACDEILKGTLHDQFVLDLIQAGAGTPFHMNANEVIANRATEILGGGKGDYDVHPNDHVNMGQSSNNVIPTAIRLTVLKLGDNLLDEIERLKESFNANAEEFDDVVKVGRTHLQDAVPVTLGQEFHAYATFCEKGIERMEEDLEELHEIGLGGNATGTGINTHEQFRDSLANHLSQVTGRDLQPADDSLAITQSMAPFAEIASSIQSWLTDMVKTADDLMLLSSGPVAGLAEITLPEVEEGSSIMPGKVNPSIVEAFKMACLDAEGNIQTVTTAAQEGDLELNVMTPVIAKNLVDTFHELTNATKMLREKCVTGIDADQEQIEELFEGSTATATALSPYLGYHLTAQIVHQALDEDVPIRKKVVEEGYLTEDEADMILDPERMTRPHGVDKELKKRIQKRLD